MKTNIDILSEINRPLYIKFLNEDQNTLVNWLNSTNKISEQIKLVDTINFTISNIFIIFAYKVRWRNW